MRIVMFAGNVSALKQDGSLPFLMLCLSTATDETIDHIFEEMVVFTSVGIFIVTTTFLLLILLGS